ncbi:MAG: cbb3-type cytochrome c oxidase subunit I [Chloroflexi bacterium]|nr:cbb3-type cytochrome c oxidase subunit I [Chloroflexota bacterium]
MPRLTVWMVRLSLVYLILGATWGSLILAAKALPWGWAWQLYPAHWLMMLFGWMIPFALAIAFWAFPRFSFRSRPRGNETLAWVTAWAYHAGLAVLWVPGLFGVALPKAIRGLAAGVMALAVLLFVADQVKRVKPPGAR